MTPANLSSVVNHATKAAPARKRAPLVTRKPTGKPPWPLVLIAGGEKAGKSYAAAVASGSKYIGRTFWIGAGEDDPDEYGAIPGADFEIVEHDGTYWGIVGAVDAAVAEPREDPAKPNLLVLDSGSRMWDMLSDEAQVLANGRKNNSTAEATITPDLWNRATQRWMTIMKLLRAHDGPVIITARLETQMKMDDNGNPTKEKHEKVKGQKGLPFDVGVVVQIPQRGKVYLTGVRSLKVDIPFDKKEEYKDFTVEKLWKDLGVTGKDATSTRQHSQVDGEKSAVTGPDWLRLFNEAKGDYSKLEALQQKAVDAGLPPTFGLFSAIDAEMTAIATAE